MNGMRKTAFYSYAEDEWKVRPNLTLNLGLRYSFYNVFHEVNGKAIPFDFATCGPGGFCAPGASFGNANKLDIDPRVSVAWAPAALHGRTVVRSGFGLYHGDGQLDDQNLPINNEVGRYSLSAKTIPDLSYPVTPFLNGPGTVSPRDMDRNRKDMYVSQWGFSIQQALRDNFVGTLSYVGSKGTYLLTTSYRTSSIQSRAPVPILTSDRLSTAEMLTTVRIKARSPACSAALLTGCWFPPITPTRTRSTRAPRAAATRSFRKTPHACPANELPGTSTSATC